MNKKTIITALVALVTMSADSQRLNKDVEHRFLDVVSGRPDIIVLRRFQFSAARAAGNDSHSFSSSWRK